MRTWYFPGFAGSFGFSSREGGIALVFLTRDGGVAQDHHDQVRHPGITYGVVVDNKWVPFTWCGESNHWLASGQRRRCAGGASRGQRRLRIKVNRNGEGGLKESHSNNNTGNPKSYSLDSSPNLLQRLLDERRRQTLRFLVGQPACRQPEFRRKAESLKRRGGKESASRRILIVKDEKRAHAIVRCQRRGGRRDPCRDHRLFEVDPKCIAATGDRSQGFEKSKEPVVWIGVG